MALDIEGLSIVVNEYRHYFSSWKQSEYDSEG